MDNFEVGDVVILKSGGPKMTIYKIGDYIVSFGPSKGAVCQWFDENVKKESLFDIRELKKPNDDH